MTSTRTVHHSELLEGDYALGLYNYFKENVAWEDGVKSRKGFTRKAKSMCLADDAVLENLVHAVLPQISINSAVLYGVYLNYYRTGEDWTPNHSHPKRRQIIISLGATRTLEVGSKKFSMKNGDVIVFGSSVHGVPKEQCLEGRISVALFLSK